MTNAWVRIRNITPSLPSSAPASLVLDMNLETRGDILLTASVKDGIVRLALPRANIAIPMPAAADIHLPPDLISVTLPAMTETLPLPAGVTRQITLRPDTTGSMNLPMTPGSITLPSLSGTLDFIGGGLGDVGLPLPSVVPLAVNLTPRNPPPQVRVTLPLSVHDPIDSASLFGLLLELGMPMVDPLASFPDAIILEGAIRDELRRLLPQLGVTLPVPPSPVPSLWEPFAGVGPTLAQIGATAASIAAAAQAAIQNVVKDALSSLTARSGRLILSEPIPTSPSPVPLPPCEVALLPTAAMARLDPLASSPILQVGFFRPGFSTAPFPFHDFAPSGAADVEIKIGNDFLRDLLCCLVEKLPNLTFHGPSTPAVTLDRNCCNWSGVTLELWPVVLSGTLSLCIVGASGSGTPPKTIELAGDFLQDNSFGRIGVKFNLMLELQLSDVAAITGLRLGSATVDPFCAINGLVWALLIGAGTVSLLVPGMLVLLIALPLIFTAFVTQQLRGVIDTLLSRAHALTSPVAVPTAIFEAFGRFVPVSMKIDDLTATGVLATPTSLWGLRPILGNLPKSGGHPDPRKENQTPSQQRAPKTH
jgi:hypothetical protein